MIIATRDKEQHVAKSKDVVLGKYVGDLVFVSRHMRPEGPWQRWLFLVTRQASWPTGLIGHSGPLIPMGKYVLWYKRKIVAAASDSEYV